jgi:membrane protein YdbS with pleckstrin-like domain
MKRGGRLEELLTLLFMLLAIAAAICFFAVDSRLPFWICGGAAVFLRMAQYTLRFFA